MKQLLVLLSTPFFLLTACNSKESVANEFKAEMMALTDECVTYMDAMLEAINKEEDVEATYNEVAPKINDALERIDETSLAFADKAEAAGLTDEEYMQVYADLEQYMSSLSQKYNKIEAAGYPLGD